MIEVSEAISLVEQAAEPLPPRRIPLLDACGRMLAAPVVSDVDSPPWDRAMMDGFAVRSADLVDRCGDLVELDVVADLVAGDVTTRPIPAGGCARIMTGAPIPPGADAVVPIESAVEGTAAVRSTSSIAVSRSIMPPRWMSGGRPAGVRSRRASENSPGGTARRGSGASCDGSP